jgi:hypothetical protein
MVIECRWAKYKRSYEVKSLDLPWKNKLLNIQIPNEKNN